SPGFFFQAEDGIRDFHVTGVQTCALPILERHYPRLVDYGFTATLEDELDEIAAGQASRVDFLRAFYFGGDLGVEGSVARAGGLKKLVTEKLGEIDAREVNSFPLLTDEPGRPAVVRVGRYGPCPQRWTAGTPWADRGPGAGD